MKKFAIIIYLVFFSSNLLTQELPVEFINTVNGLSNNHVKAVFQDSYGLLWFGTEYGLNLYDGYNFKVFRNNPEDPQSINSNVIWWIVEDKDKNLWISTGEGVSKYIRSENKFKNYNFFGDYFSSVAIYIDSNENIWAAVQPESIVKYNKEKDVWDDQKLIVDSNKTYRNPSQVIRIIEDKDNNLWIASIRFGLMWYDEEYSVFRQSEMEYDEETSEFINYDNPMVDLYSDSLGILWITSWHGIHKYNPISKKLKTLKTFALDRLDYDNYYGHINEDSYGNIWITSNSNGLFKFDGISDNFERIAVTGQKYTQEGESDIVMTNSWWDNSGIFWIGTFAKGLIKYDPNKKVFIQYAHDVNNKNSLSSSEIFSLLESSFIQDRIYIGAMGGGLNIFDSKVNSFTKISITFNKNIINSAVQTIVEENEEFLWLGTWGDGLLKINKRGKVIKRFIPNSSNINSISDDWVNVMRKDLSGNLWIGTNTGGLNYFDVENNSFKNFNKDFNRYSPNIVDIINKKIGTNSEKAKIIKVGNSQKLSSDFNIYNQEDYLIVTAGEGNSSDSLMWDYGWIEDINENIIWDSKKYSSTYHLGGERKNRIKIDIFNFNAGKYSLKYLSDDSHSYNNWNDIPPKDSNLWGIRIFRINEIDELETIKTLLHENEKSFDIKGNDIRDIHISQNNIVWIGTFQNGLHKINLNNNDVKTYLFNNTINNEGSRFNINHIYENDEKTLWLATSRGLIEFNPIEETFKYFRDQDGLPTNIIQSILPGNGKELWLGTTNGLSNMKYNLSGIPTFVSYGIEDGLGGMEFYRLVALKSKTGTYYFGGDHGLNEFDSEKSISTPPNLYLSDFKISNVSFSEIYEDSLIETSITDLENLSLNHNQNDLSFEFAALHFSDPKKNQYAHQLDGYEDDWVYDNKRTATYTNLDPGEYTFRFKGSNNEGIWNEKGKSISIIINPPWWQTWWAYLGYGFIFLGAFYGVDRVQKRKLMRKAKERMKIQAAEHRAETAELQAKAAEAQSKLIQAENERKTKELEEARQLQLSMLPKELPKIDNLEIAVYMKTATEVGGDYYDFSIKNDGSLNVCLGDATGHGMKAGTLVSMMKSLFTANSKDKSIKEFFATSNNALKNSKLDKMMMAFAVVNIKNRSIEISNAGIPPIFIYRKEKEEIEEIGVNGLPLGAMYNSKYEIYESELFISDVILMLSDGFPELQNEQNEQYGYERTKSSFQIKANKTSEEIINYLKDEGSKWVNDKDPDDDVTFVVIKIK